MLKEPQNVSIHIISPYSQNYSKTGVVIMSNRQSEAHRGEIFYPRSYTELMTEYMYVRRSAKCWETCKIQAVALNQSSSSSHSLD